MTGDKTGELLAALSPRAKSLVVTILGDALAAHGGTFWLSGLIDLAGLFGINDRLLRTVVLRLTREDWLAAQQIGRRSVYRITDAGTQRLLATRGRIYGLSREGWDGQWRFVLVHPWDQLSAKREKLKRELRWHGYGMIVPGLFAHPDTNFSELSALQAALGAEGHFVTITGAAALFGHRSADLADRAARELRSAWDLEQVAQAYDDFITRFTPYLDQNIGAEGGSAADAFRLRTLLIHEYRRTVLRDPMLPEELMPNDWVGYSARALCGRLYQRLERPSRLFLMAKIDTPSGKLPPPQPDYYERFGGLAGA